jgi:hypothetical protein
MGGLIEITPQTINAVENYIRWMEIEVPQKLPVEMNKLCVLMAFTNQSYARRMAYGPHDPSAHHPELAWRTPAQGIRRITQRYYLGWKVKKLGLADYLLYNASREAYFIEFGVSRVGFGGKRDVPVARFRRPVRKLSLLKTLRFMATTQSAHRIWADIFRSRNAHGGFTQIVQAPGGGHSIFGAFGTPNEGSGSFSGPAPGAYLP